MKLALAVMGSPLLMASKYMFRVQLPVIS